MAKSTRKSVINVTSVAPVTSPRRQLTDDHKRTLGGAYQALQVASNRVQVLAELYQAAQAELQKAVAIHGYVKGEVAAAFGLTADQLQLDDNAFVIEPEAGL